MFKFKEIAKEVELKFKNSSKSHDWEHTYRVYNLCMHIGKEEDADLEVLELAALLHDIGREEQDKSKGQICHAQKGAQIAKDMLLKYDFSKNIVDSVIHCIQTHRFRGEEIPQTKEAKILYDSDKLDSIGAIGIGRAFVFAGEIGAKVHNKYVDILKTKPYTEEDTAYREYMVKLKKVKDKVLTNQGKRIAEERHEFMEKFFERLNEEVEGEL